MLAFVGNFDADYEKTCYCRHVNNAVCETQWHTIPLCIFRKVFYKCAFLKTSKAAKILSKNNNNFFTATYYIFVFLGKWLSSFNCFWTYFLHEHVGLLLLSTTVHNLQIKLKKAINQLWIYNSRMEEGLLIFLWTLENKVCHGRPFSF